MPTPVFSIRYKIIIAFAAVYLFMAASFMGSYYFMQQLGQKIVYLEDVSKLEESVFEIRRFEKNFFLLRRLPVTPNCSLSSYEGPGHFRQKSFENRGAFIGRKISRV